MKTLKNPGIVCFIILSILFGCKENSEKSTKSIGNVYDNVIPNKNSSSISYSGPQITLQSRINNDEVVTIVLERQSNGNVKIISRDVINNQSTEILKESFIIDQVEFEDDTKLISPNGDKYWLIPFNNDADPVDVTAPIGGLVVEVSCECCALPGNPPSGSCSELIQPHPVTGDFFIRCISGGCSEGCGMEWKRGAANYLYGTAILVKAEAIE